GATRAPDTAQHSAPLAYPAPKRLPTHPPTPPQPGVSPAPPPKAPADLPRLSDPASKDPAEDRARAYLHGNCAHCHRPMGGGQGMMDLRYTQSLHDTNTCNAMNTQGTVGAATKLVVPGDPQNSIVSLRLHATDSNRMPGVAATVPDALDTKVIDAWTPSLPGCP